MKKILLALIGILAVLPASAKEYSFFQYEYEGATLKYQILDNDARTAAVCGFAEGMVPDANTPFSLVIPETANDGTADYRVTRIKRPSRVEGDVFQGSPVETVSLPPSITFIGEYAFSDCPFLREITIPAAVETISDFAFNNCSSLESIRFLGTGLTVFQDSFQDCRNLKRIEYASVAAACGIDFEEVQRTLRYDLFINGEKVTDLVIPPDVRRIGDYVFEGARISSVQISDGVEEIGSRAFSYCYLLTNVTIPASVRSIGSQAFDGCNVESVILEDGEEPIKLDSSCFPQNVTEIYFGRPHNKISPVLAKLTDVGFGPLVKEVLPEEFLRCYTIRRVTFSDGLEKIGRWAFRGNRGVESINIPGSVTEIGESAFTSTVEGIKVTFEDGQEKISMAENCFPGVPIAELYVGRPLDSFIHPLPMTLKKAEVGNAATAIVDHMFEDCTGLTSVKLGSGITEIGEESFSGCINLEEIVLPPELTTIGRRAFRGNSKLKNVFIGSRLSRIDESAFANCIEPNIYVTAQIPPTVESNTFNSFGRLYLQGQSMPVVYSMHDGWRNFTAKETMSVPSSLSIAQTDIITGKKGDTFRLTATLEPEDVSLPYIFWKSSDPEVATVSLDGVVTLRKDVEPGGSEACTITASTLYADGPLAHAYVGDDLSGVETIGGDAPQAAAIDYALPYEVYGLDGRRAGRSLDNLARGIYIVRQNGNAVKVMIKI